MVNVKSGEIMQNTGLLCRKRSATRTMNSAGRNTGLRSKHAYGEGKRESNNQYERQQPFQIFIHKILLSLVRAL